MYNLFRFMHSNIAVRFKSVEEAESFYNQFASEYPELAIWGENSVIAKIKGKWDVNSDERNGAFSLAYFKKKRIGWCSDEFYLRWGMDIVDASELIEVDDYGEIESGNTDLSSLLG